MFRKLMTTVSSLALATLMFPLSLYAQKESTQHRGSVFIKASACRVPLLFFGKKNINESLISSAIAPLYQLKFSYEFGGNTPIYIKGLGIAPAKGSFEYFTYNPSLTIQETKDGAVLVSISANAIKAECIGVSGGGERSGYPSHSDFPDNYRNERWGFSSSFTVSASAVINKLFPEGFFAYERNNINYMLTTYTPLPSLPENLRGEIAMLLSHPYNARTKSFDYHIQFLIRERRVKSGDWRPPANEETKRIAERFVNDFVKELQEAGRNNK